MQSSLSCRLTTWTLVIGILSGASCSSSSTYKAAYLPPELIAPASLDLQAINLAGLAKPSVSVEVIQPGDVLDVSMVTDYAKLTTTTTPIRIRDDGIAVLPLVGDVLVAGASVEQAEQTINAESISRGIFRTPCITVTMKQPRVRKVTVLGAVKKPGTYELPRGSTSLMAALVAAEGLTKEADTLVEIRSTDTRHMAAVMPGNNSQLVSYPPAQPTSPEPQSMKVDLTAVAAGAVTIPELHDGDVVNVTKRTLPAIHVIGLVHKPGEYPYPPDQEIRVLDALALGGGVSNPVAENILVIRRAPNAKEPVRIAVSLQNAKNGSDNITLAPGDTVTVEQTAMTAVVGILQSFVHVGVGAGMYY
ncbi:MAG: SLBB domain-containing protein [Planctomycetaceae bacterium]|nr:SLBB domain-containing protein [Planctomycetaceae bacterium]